MAATMGIQKLAIEDRGLLFGNNSTNVKTIDVDVVDVIGVEDVKVKPTAGSRRARAGKVALEPKKAATAKQKMEMWVEVETVR
jgi:hypothetical protein